MASDPQRPVPLAGKPRLARSREHRVIAGVAGGIGEYLAVEPGLIRAAFVVLTIFGGSGVLLYGLFWIFMPARGPGEVANGEPAGPGQRGDRVAFGAVLVILGLAWLLNRLIPWFDELFWPALLIAGGAAFIVYSLRK